MPRVVRRPRWCQGCRYLARPASTFAVKLWPFNSAGISPCSRSFTKGKVNVLIGPSGCCTLKVTCPWQSIDWLLPFVIDATSFSVLRLIAGAVNIAKMTVMSGELDRFIRAQDSSHFGFGAALRELETEGKRGHWIWYVFPQLVGLGSSWNSEFYGLSGTEEAIAYLRHPVLRSRLLEITRVVANRLRQEVRLTYLMGSDIDTRKLISSMTLFRTIAERVPDGEPYVQQLQELAALAEEVLARGAAQGYPPCSYTVEFLDRAA